MIAAKFGDIYKNGKSSALKMLNSTELDDTLYQIPALPLHFIRNVTLDIAKAITKK